MLLPLLLHPEGIHERTALHDCRPVIPVAYAHFHRELQSHHVALLPESVHADSLACLRRLGNSLSVDFHHRSGTPLRNAEIKREFSLLSLAAALAGEIHSHLYSLIKRIECLLLQKYLDAARNLCSHGRRGIYECCQSSVCTCIPEVLCELWPALVHVA